MREDADASSGVRAVWLIILVGTAIRLWLASSTGLGYDESYMVGNARQFAAGYIDHPPLHIWLIWAVVHAFGSEAPVVVRLPFVLLFAGSTWLMFRLSSRLFDVRAGVFAVVAFNIAPVFSLADATWVLPDGPLVFFLLAAACVVANVVVDPARKRSPFLWVAAGGLAGLALLSKFTAVFFVLGVFLWLATTPAARHHLRTPGPWLGAAAALLVLSPALVWNIEHDFAGIAFQSGRLADPRFRVDGLLLGLGGQLLYLAPWLAVPFLISLWRALRAGTAEPRGWYLALPAAGPILVFAIAALFARTLPHWAMPGWLFTIPLFGRDAARLFAERPRFARTYMAASAIAFLVLVGAFAWQATRGGLVPETMIARDPGVDPTIDLIDWTELNAALAERGLLAPGLVAAAPSWLHAGKVSYALGSGVPVLCLCSDPQQFAYRQDQRSFAGRDVLVVMPMGRGRERAAAFFDGLDPLPPVEISRAGKPVLKLDLAIGHNLQFP